MGGSDLWSNMLLLDHRGPPPQVTMEFKSRPGSMQHNVQPTILEKHYVFNKEFSGIQEVKKGVNKFRYNIKQFFKTIRNKR